MPTYTVELTDAEDKAMRLVCADVTEWIQNSARARAAIAMRDGAMAEVQRRLTEGLPLPATQDELLEAAEATETARRVELATTRVPLKP